jgi:hypothetical protein
MLKTTNYFFQISIMYAWRHITCSTKHFYLHRRLQTECGAHPTSVSNALEARSPRIKQPESEAEYSPLYSDEISSLMPNFNYMYHPLWWLLILHFTHSAFTGFIRLSEQTAIISLYRIHQHVLVMESRMIWILKIFLAALPMLISKFCPRIAPLHLNTKSLQNSALPRLISRSRPSLIRPCSTSVFSLLLVAYLHFRTFCLLFKLPSLERRVGTAWEPL